MYPPVCVYVCISVVINVNCINVFYVCSLCAYEEEKLGKESVKNNFPKGTTRKTNGLTIDVAVLFNLAVILSYPIFFFFLPVQCTTTS